MDISKEGSVKVDSDNGKRAEPSTEEIEKKQEESLISTIPTFPTNKFTLNDSVRTEFKGKHFKVKILKIQTKEEHAVFIGPKRTTKDVDLVESLKDEKKRKEFLYYIHYIGWSKKWDVWVSEDLLSLVPDDLIGLPVAKKSEAQSHPKIKSEDQSQDLISKKIKTKNPIGEKFEDQAHIEEKFEDQVQLAPIEEKFKDQVQLAPIGEKFEDQVQLAPIVEEPQVAPKTEAPILKRTFGSLLNKSKDKDAHGIICEAPIAKISKKTDGKKAHKKDRQSIICKQTLSPIPETEGTDQLCKAQKYETKHARDRISDDVQAKIAKEAKHLRLVIKAESGSFAVSDFKKRKIKIEKSNKVDSIKREDNKMSRDDTRGSWPKDQGWVLNVTVPLSNLIREDYRLIKWQKMLIRSPAKISIEDMLTDYAAFVKSTQGSLLSVNSTILYLQGLKHVFNRKYEDYLYNDERKDLYQKTTLYLKKPTANSKVKVMDSVTKLVSPIYLLRLLTKIDKHLLQTIPPDVLEKVVIPEKIRLMRFMEEKKGHYFPSSNYYFPEEIREIEMTNAVSICPA